MPDKKLEELLKLHETIEALERIQDHKKLDKRMYILDTDPNAPICIRCCHCQQQGFLFICALEVAGMTGIVYYKRRGHKPITYPDVPNKDNQCNFFEEMESLTPEELEAIEHQYSKH